MTQGTTIFTDKTETELRKPKSTYYTLTEKYLLEGELKSLGLHQDNFRALSLNALKERMAKILIEHRRFTSELVKELKEMEDTAREHIPLERIEDVSLRSGIEYSALTNELVRRIEVGEDDLKWDDFKEIMLEIESRAHPETG